VGRAEVVEHYDGRGLFRPSKKRRPHEGLQAGDSRPDRGPAAFHIELR